MSDPKHPVRILHLEDSPRDAELIQDKLEADGLACDIVRVDSRDRFEAALAGDSFDLILCDYNLPDYDGLSALKCAREQHPATPVILISGLLGEEEAVKCLHSGATDYLLKQRLDRLPSAVQRALEKAEEHRQRQQMEKQMRRAQRLESIGTLAGGVAHDLNNALAPIMMATELLRLEFPDTAARHLEIIRTGCKRGADLVKQLLTFAKGAEGERLLLQPRHLLREMEKLISSTFPKNIELRTCYAKDLPTILGDATQLHQVLLNLCVNARDAMPEGGTLTLKAESLEIDALYAGAVPEAKPGQYVVLRVTDTGSGIPPEILDRIFEPFFTTKGPDKGTGLGLSTSIGIVKGHGGFIRVHSPPGQGSAFAVYLPAAGAGTGDTPLPTQADPAFRGHGETILVVDDEPAVRHVTRALLTGLNFKVLTAADGAAALSQAADKRAEMRAVINDFHMPHLDGPTFVRVLRQMLPEAGLIVASGHLEEQEENEIKELGVSALLQKPFTPEELVAALKTVFQK